MNAVSRFLLLPCLALGACAPDPASSPRSDGRPTLDSVAARLPDTAAGFARGDTTRHEAERPGYGVTAEYAGPSRSAVATVSVYDRGRPLVAEDDAVAMGTEFNAAVEEAMTLGGSGSGPQLAERDRTQLAVPGQSALRCARLQGAYGRQQVQTLVCLGAAAGRFLRVQVTAPARQLRPVDPMPFVVAIAQAARG